MFEKTDPDGNKSHRLFQAILDLSFPMKMIVFYLESKYTYIRTHTYSRFSTFFMPKKEAKTHGNRQTYRNRQGVQLSSLRGPLIYSVFAKAFHTDARTDTASSYRCEDAS